MKLIYSKVSWTTFQNLNGHLDSHPCISSQGEQCKFKSHLEIFFISLLNLIYHLIIQRDIQFSSCLLTEQRSPFWDRFILESHLMLWMIFKLSWFLISRQPKVLLWNLIRPNLTEKLDCLSSTEYSHQNQWYSTKFSCCAFPDDYFFFLTSTLRTRWWVFITHFFFLNHYFILSFTSSHDDLKSIL